MAGAKIKAAPPDAAETSQRIMLAAESLFAERGFDGVSVRDIVSKANVNLAAINYHFGSKRALMMAIFRQRASELNKERSQRLREVLAKPALRLDDVLRALIAPPLLWRDPASGKAVASRFLSRALAEVTPELRKVLETDVSHQRAFVAAFLRARPGWGESEACWALHFAGGLAHQCSDTHFKRLDVLSHGGCDTADMPALIERAVRFALGGVDAMGAETAATAKRKIV
jgi:AcrR family transcriptional regulator